MFSTAHRLIRVALFASLAAATALATAAPDAHAPARTPPADAAPIDIWYAVEIDGSRAGHARFREFREGDHIVTVNTMKLTLGRGGMADVSVELASRWVETPGGEPVAVSSRMGGPTGAIESAWRFEGDEVVVTLGGPASRERREPAPTGFTTPAASRRAVAAHILRLDEARHDAAAPGADLVTTSLDPDGLGGLAKAVTTATGFEPVDLELLGRIVPAYRIDSRSTVNGLNARSQGYLDARGVPLRDTVSVGGAITITLVATDRDLALAEVTPPEMMARTFVTPETPIERPRAVTRATYRLSLPPDDQDRSVPAVSQGAQTASRQGPAVVVDVDPDRPPTKWTGDPAPYLRPNAVIGSDDAAIVSFATDAVRGLDAPADQAERLRLTVYRFITSKSLAAGFATAGEVVRTRVGDCTEHAVLLAAALRAVGIPARVVSGLIYADRFAGSDDVFVYHMWTQALLPIDPGDRDAGVAWADLDATRPAAAPGLPAYDATHIALGVSGMGPDEASNPMFQLVPLLGRLRVEVLRVEHAD